MLKTIKIRNFHSIGNEQELLFKIGAKDHLDNSSVKNGKDYINLVNAIIGSNASGKTNVLKAISFLFWLTKDSYTSGLQPNQLLPILAHKLHENESTFLSIEFSDAGVDYQYSVELDKQSIKKECRATTLCFNGY